MKRAMPWTNQVDVLSSDSSSSDSDSETDNGCGKANPSNKNEENTLEGAIIRRAEMYQEYMKQIQIPSHRASVIPFNSWQGLAKSIKLLYGQPLHYLTNVNLKRWDQSRINSDNENQPLDTIIHSCKAEATVWLMEEVHRLTTSHHHLARLWLSDPMDTAKTGRSKSNLIDFKALSEHGYKGGPSILNMPTPKQMDEKEPNWSWSTGKEKAANKDTEESYKERQRTRDAVAEGERLINVQTRKEKNLSFSQKEKRKRELGQASRGKNYVEEEKRLLRESGIYSGFDA